MSRYMIAIVAGAGLSLLYVFAHAETDATREEREHAAGKSYAAPEGVRVAVVDIAALFKQNPRFDAKMKELKQKVEAAEADLKEQGEKIAKLQKELGAAAIDASLKQSTTRVLAEATAQFNTQKTVEGAEFMQNEEALYWDAFQDINREIARAAARHNIDLVLRINRDPIDKTDRNDILRGINAPIQYINPKLDITEEVQAALAANYADSAN